MRAFQPHEDELTPPCHCDFPAGMQMLCCLQIAVFCYSNPPMRAPQVHAPRGVSPSSSSRLEKILDSLSLLEMMPSESLPTVLPISSLGVPPPVIDFARAHQATFHVVTILSDGSNTRTVSRERFISEPRFKPREIRAWVSLTFSPCRSRA